MVLAYLTLSFLQEEPGYKGVLAMYTHHKQPPPECHILTNLTMMFCKYNSTVISINI